MKPKVLFLCTGNSCRSQMAEGLLRHFYGDQVEAYSAGTNPTKVNPLAISVMHEKGIDISQQRSKHVTEYAGQTFRWVITVCDAAKEVCPVFPGHPTTAHFSFPDPAEAKGTEEERLAVFRSVRDRIENDLVRDFLIRFYTK